MSQSAETAFRGTTILGIHHLGKSVVIGDGQVTMNATVVKHRARKVRVLTEGKVVAGFAGATADAFTLFEKFESTFQSYQQNLVRAAVELAKQWRTDRYLRRLEALLVVADAERVLTISGTGDVIEPDDGIVGIGSGAAYAIAAARALMKHSDLAAREIALESMMIASKICIYTNDAFTIEEL